MSVDQIEHAAQALGAKLLEEVAFLGAAMLPLWITEHGAPAARATRDVDVIVEVGSLVAYYEFGEQLRKAGFQEDPAARHMCAWKHLDTGLPLDVMPVDESVLGFTNRWYESAFSAAIRMTLPSGTSIRAVSPPYLLATKFEAFKGRGTVNGQLDYLGSRDFGDIVVLVDGRTELVAEIESADAELREYLAMELVGMQDDFGFSGGVAGQLMPDRASQQRQPLVIERIQQIVSSRPSES